MPWEVWVVLLLDHRSPSGRCSAAWSVAAHPADQRHVGSDGRIVASGLKKGQHQFLRHVVIGSILVGAGLDFPEGSNMLIMEFGSHYHRFLFLARAAILPWNRASGSSGRFVHLACRICYRCRFLGSDLREIAPDEPLQDWLHWTMKKKVTVSWWGKYPVVIFVTIQDSGWLNNFGQNHITVLSLDLANLKGKAKKITKKKKKEFQFTV